MSLRSLSRIAVLACALLAVLPRGARGEPAERPKVGKPHAPLALWTLERDRPVSLASLRGTKVLLVHFASWRQESWEPAAAWFERTKKLVAEKKLVVLGVDHEFHADRGRLFAQWKGLSGTLLHDPLDLSGVTDLPMVVAVDEAGIIRAIQPPIEEIEKTFVNRAGPKKDQPLIPEEAALPDPRVTRRTADEARQAIASRAHADALVLSGLPPQIEEAIGVYRAVIEKEPKDAWAYFRLGTAYRMRYEREERQPGDFQEAVDAWEQAARLAPNCAIFRQRWCQYGPAIEKKGPCYEWIPVAQQEMVRRGQKPIELEIEPLAMEMALRSSGSARPPSASKGNVLTDKNGLVQIESTVVRTADKKQAGVMEVHLTLRPVEAEWDESAGPVRIWLEKSKTAKLERQFIEFPKAKSEAAKGPLTASFQVELKSKSKDKATLKGEAVYGVLSGGGGKGKLLRQEFKIAIAGKPERKVAGSGGKAGQEGGEGRGGRD